MVENIKKEILSTDVIFNESTRETIGTSAKRLAPNGRSQETYPLSIVLCLSKVSYTPLNFSEEVDVSEETLIRELEQMRERFEAVLYASTLEMSEIFSSLNPDTGESKMIDIDRKRPETKLTTFMASSLGATDDVSYITAGFTLDTSRISNLIKLLGRLESVVLSGYIKYFRLYRVTDSGTYLIGNDGELFSSYCREICAGRPTDRIKIDQEDSRYINLNKIFKRTFCTKEDIRESVHQAFDESYNELCAELLQQNRIYNGQIYAQKINVKLLQKIQSII